MKAKILVILGPTATGKSDLAVSLAKRLNGEVISADSRQVYKGLDIGTGKITKKEMGRIPHHLLDVADPKKAFSVTAFVKLAEVAIQNIVSRGKLPIICGGTGFYISALVDGLIFPDVPPHIALRSRLSKKNLVQLYDTLKKLDHDRAATIDKDNPVRLIRAIEIATAIGKVPPVRSNPSKFDATFIGLQASPQLLRKRIHDRLIKRMKGGMLAEIRNLHAGGLSWKRMEELGLEYRYLAYYFQKKITLEKMLADLELAIWHYAKRQMTWFRRDKRIKWVEVGDGNLENLTNKL